MRRLDEITRRITKTLEEKRMEIKELKGVFKYETPAGIVFGSRNKPEWRPMQRGTFQGQLQPGNAYAIKVQGSQLIAADDLGAPSGGGGAGGAGAPAPAGQAMDKRGLMASAVGLSKSLLESGSIGATEEQYREAVRRTSNATIVFYKMLKEIETAAVKQVEEVQQVGDPNDDIPF